MSRPPLNLIESTQRGDTPAAAPDNELMRPA